MYRTMKKIIAWSLASIAGIVIFVYAVLASFLWWADHYEKPAESASKPVHVRSLEQHSLELINDGLISLSRRIELIEQAKESIELEFFIYELDLAAKILTQKLVEAAARGVKVNLLVDFAAPVFKLRPAYALAMKQRGVKVRYYNTSSIFRFVSSQHRSHRKLLLVDGKLAITGGRNIGNDYFNLSPTYNFLDSDVLVEGEIVKAMRTSFFFYWESDLATNPTDVQNSDPVFDAEFLEPSDETKQFFVNLKDVIQNYKARQKRHFCNDLSFVTDYSGIPSYNRQVYRRLEEFLQDAKEEVVGESPYFILRADGMALLRQMNDRGVRQVFLTNGLASTDAFYTVSAMTFTLRELAQNRIDVRLYDGSPPSDAVLMKPSTSERWGVHAKRAVVDRKHVLIGTYNVDPRSANLNSELMLICRNQPELAAEMILDIDKRLQNSNQLFTDNKDPLTVLMGGASEKQKLLFVLALPLANLFDFLL